MFGNRKQAPKSRHDRGEREKQMAPRQPKLDPDKEIVILQYAESKPSNLSKFKRWIGPLCVEKYGVLGTLIETGVLPVIPALAAPDMQVLDPDVDILGIEKARYLGEMKSRQSRVDEIENNTKRMFAFIWRHMSDESKEIVASQGGWDQIQQDYNIQLMWAAIVQTHQGGGMGVDIINPTQRPEDLHLHPAGTVRKHPRIPQALHGHIGGLCASHRRPGPTTTTVSGFHSCT